MNHLVILLLLLILALNLTGCGGGGEDDLLPPQISCDVEVGTASLSGMVSYQDRLYTESSGFMGVEPFKAVRHAVVELVNEQAQVIASTASDDSGAFSFADIDSGCYQVRVLAQTASTSHYAISVRDLLSALYAVTRDVKLYPDPTANSLSLAIDRNSGMAGVFNILDVLTIGNEYLNTLQGAVNVLTTLNAYWQVGNGAGTYACGVSDIYGCDNGPGIYILNGTVDSDEHDDDVLWHEYFHFIENELNIGNSPGGMHYFENNQLDLRLTWSEGYANYFQSSLKAWLRENYPQRLSIPSFLPTSYYIDNYETTAAISADISAMKVSPYLYATNEGAVANVMWELEQSYTRQLSWSVLMNHMKSNTTVDTLEAYWDGINLLGTLSIPQRQDIQTLLMGRQIFYTWDSNEQDNLMADATVQDCQTTGVSSFPYTCINGAQHYLYQSVEGRDVDYYAITLTANHTYRFYTYNLRNGADTLITLYDAAGSEIVSNDDGTDCDDIVGKCISPMHNGSNFSSRLDYIPSSDETIYIAITTGPSVYDYPAGFGYLARYGSYQFSVVIDP